MLKKIVSWFAKNFRDISQTPVTLSEEEKRESLARTKAEARKFLQEQGYKGQIKIVSSERKKPISNSVLNSKTVSSQIHNSGSSNDINEMVHRNAIHSFIDTNINNSCDNDTSSSCSD